MKRAEDRSGGRKERKKEIKAFCVNAAAAAGVMFVMFGIVLGVSAVPDNSMEPVLSFADIVVYNRLDKDISPGDVVVYEADGGTRIGRIAAAEGDTVDIAEDSLFINGGRSLESDIFYDTSRYESDTELPLTLEKDEYFILGDKRDEAYDSRMFGAVSISDIKGTLFLAVRREGF